MPMIGNESVGFGFGAISVNFSADLFRTTVFFGLVRAFEEAVDFFAVDAESFLGEGTAGFIALAMCEPNLLNSGVSNLFNYKCADSVPCESICHFT